jgi:glycosyltransferase involved in cell wall biosynthesis
MKRVAIVCPVFREQEIIRSFHETLVANLGAVKDRYEFAIVYVVDPSPDNTASILKEIAEMSDNVTILVLSRRFGHQAALMAGLDAAGSADAVIMLDSDLQHPPSLIPVLLARWDDGADVVQAIREDTVRIPMLKRQTSSLFYRILYKMTSIELQRGAADFRLLDRRVVALFQTAIREKNPFIRGLVSWVGFTVAYVPFQCDPRPAGKSKYSVLALFNFALNGICSFSKMPLRLCIGAGFGIAILSFAGGIAQVLLYVFQSRIRVPGWASLFAAVSFLSGIQLIFLGVLGEYVSLIFDEVKNRPLYVVAERVASRPDLDGAAKQHDVRKPSEPLPIS